MYTWIVFENERLLIVNKPNNVLVHHSHYARNIKDESLLQLLRQQLCFNIFPINRLDRKTSGLIMLSKSKEDFADYQKLFTANLITKKYLALVRGWVEKECIIDSPVKNERGNYKDAESHLRPIKKFHLDIPVQPYPSSRYSLVEFEPVTGRTHQLRIHANKISHPIIGDHKYGNRHHNKMFADNFGIDNLYLHSKSLEFVDPFTKQEISIQADLPHFWGSFLEDERLTQPQI